MKSKSQWFNDPVLISMATAFIIGIVFILIMAILMTAGVQYPGPVTTRVEAVIYGIRNDRSDMYPQFAAVNGKRYSTDLDGNNTINETIRIGDKVQLDLNSDNYVITFIDETEQTSICAYAAKCEY